MNRDGSLLESVFHIFFRAPRMPEIELPFAARLVPGVRVAIGEAFKLAYSRGAADGFLFGVLVGALAVALATRRRP